MTHIMEHKSFRYSWELVRHTYLVDLESEIEIRQVEISPLQENRMLDPPYPFTPFFEFEIDQIQKNGKTVFSLRNICPVQVDRNAGWNFLNSLMKSGSSRITKRFQSQDGDTEIRWLYTDDFFLISLSSGDRHDLDMLVSLVISKLNTIGLSFQSGKRIQSEFENQQKFRAVMSDMFAEGVDGAFRDVPVYVQHGDMTDNTIDVSAALMSSEFQDLMAVCASEDGAGSKAVPAAINTRGEPVAKGDNPAEVVLAKGAGAGTVTYEHVPEVQPRETVREGISPAESVAEKEYVAPEPVAESTLLADIIPEENVATENVTGSALTAGSVSEDRVPAVTVAESPLAAESPGDNSQSHSILEGSSPVNVVPESRCNSCGASISPAKKFCGNCGAAVNVARPPENAPAASAVPAGSANKPPAAPTPREVEPAVNLKSIEELEDLSWLSD